MIPVRKFPQRRALMATSGGALALIALPPTESDPPASFAQFLSREKARERQRNAEARAHPIRIG